MEQSQIDKHYLKIGVPELLRKLYYHKIGFALLEIEWHEGLLNHLKNRELSEVEKNAYSYINETDIETLKNRNINNILVAENSNVSEDKSINTTDVLMQKMKNDLLYNNKYPALNFISSLLMGFGIFFAICTVVIALFFLFDNKHLFTLLTFASGGILVVGIIAFSEIIKVYVDLEYNSRIIIHSIKDNKYNSSKQNNSNKD